MLLLLLLYLLTTSVVEEGTQGLHYCRLIPFRDNPISDPQQLEALAELRSQAKILAE